MQYTINGKDYTELDIKKRCAELMGIEIFSSYRYVFNKNNLVNQYMDKGVKWHHPAESEECFFTKVYANPASYLDCAYNPYNNIQDTWPIIEKCWDVLNKHCYADNRTIWQLTMQKHNCTKLVAACICFIEMNEDK